jgi:hypothetical protein
MVPDNVMRTDPLYQRAFELGIFNPDRSSNLIELAGNEEALKAGRELLAKSHPDVKVSDFTHYTQHPKYDGLVREEIKAVLRDLKRSRGLSNLADKDFVPQMKADEIKAVIERIEIRMRHGLMNDDQKLYRQIPKRDNNSLALNSNESSIDFA